MLASKGGNGKSGPRDRPEPFRGAGRDHSCRDRPSPARVRQIVGVGWGVGVGAGVGVTKAPRTAKTRRAELFALELTPP